MASGVAVGWTDKGRRGAMFSARAVDFAGDPQALAEGAQHADSASATAARISVLGSLFFIRISFSVVGTGVSPALGLEFAAAAGGAATVRTGQQRRYRFFPPNPLEIPSDDRF